MSQICHSCNKYFNLKEFRTLTNKKRSRKCKACVRKASIIEEVLPEEIAWYDGISDIIDGKVKSTTKLFWIYSDALCMKVQDDLMLSDDTLDQYEFFHFEGDKTVNKKKITDLFRSESRSPRKTIIILNLKSPSPTSYFFTLIKYLIDEIHIPYVFVFTEAYYPSYQHLIKSIPTDVYMSIKEVLARDWLSSVSASSDDIMIRTP